MRLSFTKVTLIMAALLALAVIITSTYRRRVYDAGGSSVVVVFLRSADTEGMRRALRDDAPSASLPWMEQGVTFRSCIAPSPWYPAIAASLLTGAAPSVHGLHRGHAYLTQEAKTLGEALGINGFRTFAAVGPDSLLEPLNVLQGFHVEQTVDPRQTVPALIRFRESLPAYRTFLAVVELDLDAFGGPAVLPKVLDILYEGLGKDSFLARGVIALVAPDLGEEGREDSDRFNPRLPVLLAGDPLRIAGNKCVLKSVSLCDLNATLLSAALGQGFDLRDSIREGRPAVFESADLEADAPSDKSRQPPPYFRREVWFDDEMDGYRQGPDGRLVRIPEPDDRAPVEGLTGEEAAARAAGRLADWIAGLEPLPDVTIPQYAGCRLQHHWMAALGPAWNRPEFRGRALHAVEHVRLAEALVKRGFAALAVAELHRALAIDPDFAYAAYFLAQTYASIDPKGAERYFKDFVNRFGSAPEQAERVKAAQQYLGLAAF